MSVELIDSFEGVASADLVNKWPLSFGSYGVTNSPAPRTGSQCLFTPNVSAVVRQLPANQTTLIMGFAFRATSFGGDQGEIFGFKDAGTSQIDYRMIQGGGGTARITRQGTTVGSVIGAIVNPGVWTHIQIKVLFHATLGTVEVKYDDVSVYTVTGVNTTATGNAYANRIFLGYGNSGSGSAATQYFDDFYCYNGATAINNDFGGDLKVVSLLPVGNGAVQNFLRSTGASNVLNVNEATPNGDTNYNYTSTVNDIDLYTFGALSGASGIRTVQLTNIARKDDVGTRKVNGITRIGVNNYPGTGTAYPLAISYAAALEQFEVDPSTVVAWTQAGINAAQFGMKLSA